jgi:hypothetical protein
VTKKIVSHEAAVRACIAVITGTMLAFGLWLCFRLVKPNLEALRAYKQMLPFHSIGMALTVGASLLLFAALTMALRLWRSLTLGLVRFPMSVWVMCVAAFWLLMESSHPRLAFVPIVGGALLALALKSSGRRTSEPRRKPTDALEEDLPVPQNGVDLLGRRAIIDTLIGRVLFERPLVIAVTGPYGEGKTSFLNLLLGEIKKVDPRDLPIIVNFSPWLASDSNALVLSLLNSIVSEMNKIYMLPGLRRNAIEYARTLLSVIPKVDRFRSVLSELSQEDRITGLAKRISQTDRRVLIILDDLDRMEGKELETVFKLLRGSEAFRTFTFICAFDMIELVRILKATRPHQDIESFVEKFFQLIVPLPKVEAAQIRDLLLTKLASIVVQYEFAQKDLTKSLSDMWERGAGEYFRNLRRVKLFLNQIDHSLARIGTEVNVEDFVRLELVRDIAPSIYEEIYLNPENFYDADLAFEVAYTAKGALATLDDTKAKQKRADYYDRILAEVPSDKQYVSQILEDLFPLFAAYKGRIGTAHVSAHEAEVKKRLFHPRYFRQYFMLKVPSELVSEEEFTAFLSEVRDASEEKAMGTFNTTFRAMVKEDFKRWHFVHRIENIFDGLSLRVARGLCRGMAQNSSIWSSDSFEFMSAVRCTLTTLSKMTVVSERESFLELLIREYGSSLCALLLVEILEKEARDRLPSNLQRIKDVLKKVMRERYLVRDAPSVFEEFENDMGRIEPIRFLFAWRHLGSDAEQEQRKYLLDLLARRSSDLNWFLKAMFRVDFMDDYSALKPLVDYDKLADLVNRNGNVLDNGVVEKFRARYKADWGSI